MKINKLTQKIILLVGVFSLVIIPSFIFAQDTNQAPIEYTLLAPLPIESGTTVSTNDFAKYAQNMITFIIGFSAVLAVLMIMVGGFLYMTGEAIGAKAQGKGYMTNAIYGLLLLLCSFLILNTINPDLVNLNLKVDKIDLPDPPSSNECYRHTLPGGGESSCFNSLDACQQVGPGCVLSQSGASNDSLRHCFTTGDSRGRTGTSCYANKAACVAAKGNSSLVSDCFPNPLNSTGPRDITYNSPEYGKTLTCTDCVALERISIKTGQCKGEQCVVNIGLRDKLTNLASNQTTPWHVTEAWPPTVKHQSTCHQVGSCVDINFINGFGPSDPNATTEQAKAIFNFGEAARKSGGFGAEAIQYEVKDGTRASALQKEIDKLLESTYPNSDVDHVVVIKVVEKITAEHFSVYNFD